MNKTSYRSLTSCGVSTPIGNACHEHHLGLEGSDCKVCVSDSEVSGDQSATVVTKVPAKADVSTAQILAGIVQLDGESDGLVLDEVLVILVDIIDLGK